MPKRLEFGKFVDKTFWALLCAVALYSSQELKSIGDNVSELNEKMAVVLSRLSNSDLRMNEINKRLDRLEKITSE